MKIALLGYGKEGQAAEEYFKKHGATDIIVFDKFTDADLVEKNWADFDLILRSPSVKPRAEWSSMTRYFFEHCPCPIIGVTGTKGKGTTCSLITAILQEIIGDKVHLVGNIGIPAITILDSLTPNDVVVFEMSSFQLWDMNLSPKIAVVTMVEPDHLNIHYDYEDYINAKMNIARWQTADNTILYYGSNAESKHIAEVSKAPKIPYAASDIPADILDSLYIIGDHNRNNAAGAIMAAASYFGLNTDDFIKKYHDEIKRGLAAFHGLPHRLEFLRELNGVKYFDDNFSTNIASTRVAVEALKNNNVVIIVGGRDKTNYEDLPELYQILAANQIKKIILMGESGHELATRYHDERFIVAETLDEAIKQAKAQAEQLDNAIVLMSPAAASFDMFKDVYDRGAQFATKIKDLGAVPMHQ